MPAWKRNLYAIWVAELLAIAGFGSISPILPFYVRDLGVEDPAVLKIWVGAIQTSGSIMVAVFSPIWGRLADSHGRRLMFLRALFGGSLMMTFMGLASHPWQLVVFRGIGGMFTGTVAAATVLVATSVPKERTGASLGMLQTAILVGSAVGPLVGGTVADFFGYRATFFVTAGLLLSAALIVLTQVRESFTRRPHTGGFLSRIVPDFSQITSSPELFALLLLAATVNLAGGLLIPILPLFIQSLAGDGGMLGSTAGLIIGMRAFAGTFAAASVGRLSDRVGYRRVLLACTAGGVLAHLPLVLVTTPWQLLIVRILGGFFLGGTLPAINALIAVKAESGRQGAVYGLASSMSSTGSALGPAVGASIAAATGFAPVFLTAAAILAAGFVLVAALVRPRSETAGEGQSADPR
jgi:DHA1 family multidrug resistance protein-like MFS transporter